MANIRSEYIKNLMNDKDELNKSLKEATKDALKSIVDEAVNKNLRSMISEADEDDYDVEDAKDLEKFEEEPEDLKSDEKADDEAAEEGEESTEDGEESTEDGEEIWDSIEDLKDEDGEYDLTNMDSEEVVKILKAMDPEDGVRIVKNEDEEFEVVFDDDLGDESDDEEPIDGFELEIEPDGEEDDDEFDIEIEECGTELEEGKVDLGYTDNYQKVTAMTMDPDDGEKTRKWNAGTPTGNGKRWVGHKGDMSPFNKKVNSELEEAAMVRTENDPTARGTTMSQSATPKENRKKRNTRYQGRQVTGTGESPTNNSDETNESIKRKARAIFEENKQLKAIAEQIKDRLNDACVVNASLGKIIKLVTENSTTRDEKINIVNRFNNVKTINEGKELYETISNELKNSHSINNVGKTMDVQLSEVKKGEIVETSMYKSEDLAETLSLMERLDRIK